MIIRSFWLSVSILLLAPVAECFVGMVNPSKQFVSPSEAAEGSYKTLPSLMSASTSEDRKEVQEQKKSTSKEHFITELENAIAFDTSAASNILKELADMREQKKSRDEIDSFLDSLLENGPDSRLPFWSRSRRLARFSRRARMAALKRTLDRTTPPPNDNESEGDDEETEQNNQRRRRTLVSILRTIDENEFGNDSASSTTVPCIVKLEKRAIQAEKDDATNLKNRLPEGLETPEYDVISSKISTGNIEVRKYKPYSVCAVTMNKPRPAKSEKTDAKVQNPEMSGASSFGALAGYLFGKNQESTAMKMTTPVFNSPVDQGDRQMEFVLPSDYWQSVGSAPKPFEESGVTLQKKDPGTRAVLMFGGYASKKEVEKRKLELMNALGATEDWKILEEDATVAQYNDPFTPAWKRLNEISIKVEPVVCD